MAIGKQQYRDYKEGKADKPSVTFLSLCKLYVQIKQELPWLRELPSDTVRSTLKHLAEAYKRYLAGAEFPDGKRKYKTAPKFTVPQDIKIKGQKIYIPKVGWAQVDGPEPLRRLQTQAGHVQV